MKSKSEKSLGLNGIQTHDLCDTGAVLLPTELSSQLRAGATIHHKCIHQNLNKFFVQAEEFIFYMLMSLYTVC